jgi:hypothetical protein
MNNIRRVARVLFFRVRRFFGWLWSLRPWAPKPAPSFFFVRKGDAMPRGSTDGDVCLVGDAPDDGRMYMWIGRRWVLPN